MHNTCTFAQEIKCNSRYMSVHGVQLASEKKVRALSNDMVGDNLVAEEVPLSQPLRLGLDLVLAPLVYVPDLVGKVFQMLDQNARYQVYTVKNIDMYILFELIHSANSLTWHNGIIPESEIWLKMGGDRGSDTVKVIFQICNVAHPNSVNNTCVFCVFEGKDTTTNLHVALDRYRPQVEHLLTAEWRYMYTYKKCTCKEYTYSNDLGVRDFEFSCQVIMSSYAACMDSLELKVR